MQRRILSILTLLLYSRFSRLLRTTAVLAVFFAVLQLVAWYITKRFVKVLRMTRIIARVGFSVPCVLIALLALYTPVSAAHQSLPAVAERTRPSVVVVLGYDEDGRITGQGSGFFINKDGDLITSLHVLKGANTAEAKTADGKNYPAWWEGCNEDRERDLVLIHSTSVPQTVIHPVLVSTQVPQVGEQIAVVGSPLGLEQTVSDGIISAVRHIEDFGRIIQLTAPISEGSSGSPVVNMKGEVIGVAAFQIVGGENLNFAVPAVTILKLQRKWLVSQGAMAELMAHFLEEEKGDVEKVRSSLEDALSYYIKAVEKDPTYADGYFSIGDCNEKLGRSQEALDAYKQALGLYYQVMSVEPNYDTYCGIGNCYRKLGRYAQAIDAYKEAIRINPDSWEAHTGIGAAYVKVGDKASALQEYRILMDIDSYHADMLFDFIYERKNEKVKGKSK